MPKHTIKNITMRGHSSVILYCLETLMLYQSSHVHSKYGYDVEE
jgi:hypothetical protein